jgi:ADP-heptose:LPS heptosyltransferase
MAFNVGDFYRKTRSARKVFAVQLGYLGDTLQLVPALWEIKRNYPGAELHVATAAVGGELLAMVPCVDRAWPLARTPRGTPWRAQWRWLRAVRRERFDVGFNFSGVDRAVILTFLSGAGARVAFATGRHHFWNRWLIPHWVPRVDRTVHVAEQQRRMLAACGLEIGPARYDLRIPPPAIEWAKAQVPSGSVHLSVNASHGLKEWPLDRWIRLARELLDLDPAVMVVATGTAQAREIERLRQFDTALADARVRIFAGDLDLARLAGLLGCCRLHIGADSGALHLAAVLGVPTVALFREYAGLDEWLPRGEAHRQVVVPCRCVNRKEQPCLAGGQAGCLASVAVESVVGLARSLWTRKDPAVPISGVGQCVG